MSTATTVCSGKESAQTDIANLLYLSSLAKLGVQAKLRDGRIVLAPKERITPKMRQVIAAKREEIIAELHTYMDLLASRSEKQQSSRALRIWSRYADSRHDLDACEAAWSQLYLACARYNIPAWWGPDREVEPLRPYGYIKDELVDGQWFYRPMLADRDGMDYIWSLD